MKCPKLFIMVCVDKISFDKIKTHSDIPMAFNSVQLRNGYDEIFLKLTDLTPTISWREWLDGIYSQQRIVVFILFFFNSGGFLTLLKLTHTIKHLK